MLWQCQLKFELIQLTHDPQIDPNAHAAPILSTQLQVSNLLIIL